MDFFARQRLRLTRSKALLGAFALSLVFTGVFIHVVIGVLSWLIGESAHPLHPSGPASTLIAIVWLAIVAGCLFRWLDVRDGGGGLAEQLGGQRIDTRTRDDGERKLLRATAEMAIASVTRPPALYVLQYERSINACVLSGLQGEPVILVSRGALDRLDAAQLQSLVAHEFGHIVSGDLPLNMRLLIAVSGLMAVDEIGRLLMGRHPDELLHPGVVVGLLLRALGSAGLLSALLLRAAFSRQREYLADASAVQFTRNPAALAALLATIRDEDAVHALKAPRAESLAHLCIHDGRHSAWYRQWFASHPTLSARIHQIDPHYALRQRAHERRALQERLRDEGASATAPAQGRSATSGLGIGTDTGIGTGAHTAAFFTAPAPAHPSEAAGANITASATETSAEPLCTAAAATEAAHPLPVLITVDGLSSPMTPEQALDQLLPDVPKCVAAVAALVVLAGDSDPQRVTLADVDDGINAADGLLRVMGRADRQRILKHLKPLEAEGDLFDSHAIGTVLKHWAEIARYGEGELIDHVGSALALRMGLHARQRLLLRLEQLVSKQSGYVLMSLARLRLLRRRLAADYPVLAQRVDGQPVMGRHQRIRSFDAMAAELALVLSLLVEASATDSTTEEQLDQEFATALRAYTTQRYTRRCSDEPGVLHELERAFQTLLNQPSPIRRALVQHCEEIVHRDGVVTPHEISFVRMLAEALGCQAEVCQLAA